MDILAPTVKYSWMHTRTSQENLPSKMNRAQRWLTVDTVGNERYQYIFIYCMYSKMIQVILVSPTRSISFLKKIMLVLPQVAKKKQNHFLYRILCILREWVCNLTGLQQATSKRRGILAGLTAPTPGEQGSPPPLPASGPHLWQANWLMGHVLSLPHLVSRATPGTFRILHCCWGKPGTHPLSQKTKMHTRSPSNENDLSRSMILKGEGGPLA